MKPSNPIGRGKKTWQQLQEIIRFGYSSSEIFSDFVDICLCALLSFTDNMQYADIVDRLTENKLTGIYEERYMKYVEKYKENKTRKSGERPMDFFSKAWGSLQAETQESEVDILGELFESQISLGEHGQFFTPNPACDILTQMLGATDGERVNNPACGSGRVFISMAKTNPNLHFYGTDISPVCARMTVLNMFLFNLNADIYQGNSLSMEMSYLWRIRRGGFIWEWKITADQAQQARVEPAKKKPTPTIQPTPKKQEPIGPVVQQTLFDT